MSDVTNRKQILRIDCNTCRSNGYVSRNGSEEVCNDCGGSGMREKEVDYKFDTMGVWKPEEIAEQFNMKPEEIRDEGHDAPSLNGTSSDAI